MRIDDLEQNFEETLYIKRESVLQFENLKLGRLKYVLKKPSHGRRFLRLLCGMISIDYLEYNFEEKECIKQTKCAANRNPNLETLNRDV